MRRLVIFGDSWTTGYYQDRDDTTGFTIGRGFPSHLGDRLREELGCEVLNLGRAGASNPLIAHHVMRYMLSGEMRPTDSILVVWSEYKRYYALDDTKGILDYDDFDYIIHLNKFRHDNEEFRQVWPEQRNIAVWRMLNEQAMHSVRMVCEDNNIPYRMTNSFDNTWIVDKHIWQGELRPIKNYKGKSLDNYIDADKPHNTLMDVLSGIYNDPALKDNWNLSFHDKLTILIGKRERHKHIDELFTPCNHPSPKGIKVLAKHLAPYIKPIIEE